LGIRSGYLVSREIADAIMRIAASVGTIMGQAAKWDKLGTGLAGRIFELFVGNASMTFSRQQIALGVGSSHRSGHFDNEMGRLIRNALIVREGSDYRLNPNL
jgi:hypothetical protein